MIEPYTTQQLFDQPADITVGQLLAMNPKLRMAVNKNLRKPIVRKKDETTEKRTTANEEKDENEATEVEDLMAINTSKPSDDKSSALYCEASIKHIKFPLIVDSGSAGSIMSLTLLKDLQMEITRASKTVMVNVNGERRRPLGAVSAIPLNIMGRIIPMDAIVTDADSYAAIVGNDWLRKTKANIDYGTNELTLKWEDEILRVPTECQTMPHHITTIEVPDIEEDEDVEEETVEEEADEAIEESEEEYETEDDEKQQEQLSQWTSPVVVVEKKNGKKRLCVDYRKLNKVTKRDCYPLPRIDDMLETLSGSQWFSSLDLASGLWQVELDQKDREKSTFITRFGTYEFTVMPFGLCNAPATFQRLMDTVLRDILWQFVVVYIDDINVGSKTFEEHLLHLEQVFSRLAQAGLKLSPEKCFFFKDEIPFLGHVVSRHGIQTDPEKLRVIKEFPIPKDLTQLRGFIALASYYRKFVKNFSRIVEPLNRLLKKNTPFVWGNDQVDSFEYLKTCLMTPPILSYPNFEKPFILYTDASTFALGAILSQKNEDKKERVIAYASRTLGKHERNYGITELECLAVVWAVKHFHHYLHGQKFTVITDHAALRYLLNLSNPAGRLGRWLMFLNSYNLEIINRPGKQHTNFLTTLLLPVHLSKEQQAAIKRKSRYFVVIDEQLYKKNKSNPNRPLKVVKQDEIDDVLHHMHSDPLAGHFSLDETYRKIKIRYYWPQMFEDVRNYVKTCDECQRREFKVATSAMLNIGNDEQEDLLNRVRMISGRMAEERLVTQDRIYDQQQRQKQKYGKNIKEQYYKIGDLVLLYKSHLRERKKLEERWTGPYYIHEVRENGVYKLRTMEGKILKVPVNSERLKQYYSRGDLV
ncbi:retroviral-like aspartic protease 1 [Rhizophagus clarus]|uniref:RNA-directed DNA polymerase n=1 Tax=Rhizophagus clarus TaxID=94130 RepID=A0A8H3LVK9_9GLOM|nr:retroviral-like aspartic protease 1 [Rhizophagus clarus]